MSIMLGMQPGRLLVCSWAVICYSFLRVLKKRNESSTFMFISRSVYCFVVLLLNIAGFPWSTYYPQSQFVTLFVGLPQ